MFFPKNDDQYHSLKHITELLLSEFIRIFGKEVMENENCSIYNCPQKSCPILLNTNPSVISLACARLNYWCQVIFQLSHEMCHFSIRQKKLGSRRCYTVSWFEELICEAFSLYCLKYSADHWLECPLSIINTSYGTSISQYLKNELCKQGNERFRSIYTLNDLLVYENEKVSENDRDSQRNERNLLYYEILKAPEECLELCNYQDYLVAPNYVTIDFDKWLLDTDKNIVRFIRTLVHFD